VPESKRVLWVLAALLVLICGVAYYFFMPLAEVATVHRGTAISAVYGTVRIEPSFIVHVRAQNSGFIQLAEEFAAGRGAIGKSVTRGQLLARIADEATGRQLKQARADLQAATERAKLPLPSEELLKTAEDNLHRLEQVVASGNVPAVEYEKSKSEVNRLRGALENERIERDRNLQALQETEKKLESQMRASEIRAPMNGLLTAVSTIDNELVAEGNQLFTVSSRRTYVRGEVNEMNIITGTHENALLVPTRALLVDQALVIKRGIVQRRTIKVGFRTLDFTEALSGVSTGERVVVADQDRLKPGEPVRQLRVDASKK